MNNFQRGEKLLSEAESISRELTNVFQRNLPNLVVRRSQEIVEISLRALLKGSPSFYFEKDHTLEEARLERSTRYITG